jgi:glycerol transport system ATP-binding protein
LSKLELSQISKTVGAETHLYPMSLSLQPGAVTVLLGATQAGKTSVMRVMAGLDVPSTGRLLVDGQEVTGRPVRDRNVAMVYQQFINYPSMTVFENIASPLRLRDDPDVDARVRSLAQRLRIDPFLQRLPAELSGGQQQRVALARALAKNAPLMLLDEPLVNLDYKLREELREELTQLFANGSSTVVYATTDPGEALLLGGYTAVLKEGRLLQYGPTLEVFRRPASLDVARAFSDPPLNVAPAHPHAQGWQLRNGPLLVLPQLASSGADVWVGVRAAALRVAARPGDVSIQGRVQLAEISGTDTYVHVHSPMGEWVMQLTGVHFFALGASVTAYFSPHDVYVFQTDGALLSAPQEGC